MKRAAVALCLLSLGLNGCFWRWFGGGVEGAPVEDARAVGFQQRAQGFYHLLERVPLDSQLNYDNRSLHQYFERRSAFNDYFAALATQIRASSLRDSQARRVEITEFSWRGEDEAVALVTLYGLHERRLRFWEIELQRTDTWRLVDGTWLLIPQAL